MKHNKKLLSIILTLGLLVTEAAGFPYTVMGASNDLMSGDDAIVTIAEDVNTDDPDAGIPAEGVSDNSAAEAPEDSQDAAPGDDDPVIGENADTVAAGSLPYGLTGMTDYSPSSSDLYIKQDILNHDVLGDLDKLTAGIDYVKDQVIFEADSEAYAQEVAKAYNAELVSCKLGIATIKLNTTAISVAQAVELSTDPAVPLPPVCPNYIRNLTDPIPSKGYTSNEIDGLSKTMGINVRPYDWNYWTWDDPGLDPTGTFADPDADGAIKSTYQWMHDTVGSYEAWGKDFKSEPGITVAVIDTGVYADHEDFYPIGGTSIVSEYHVITDGSEEDWSGHGTHVAGIIAARLNNLGGAGIAPFSNVKILSLPVFKTFTEEGETYNSAFDEDIIAAINYVANTSEARKADIINMSLGGPSYNPLAQAAIDKAYEAGVTICAAMGNDGTNNVAYPAGYNHVIAVSAVDISYNKSDFSTYGSWADISAPGTAIFSSWNGHNWNERTHTGNKNANYHYYTVWNGTSMACPVVAGACAVYMDIYGHTDPDTMESVLKKSATKVKGSGLGAGIVNVAAMIPNDDLPPVITAMDSTFTTEKPLTSLTPDDYIVFREDPKSTAGTNAIVYTLDGSKPKYKNGEATNGNVAYADFIAGKTGVAVRVGDLIDCGYLNSGETVTLTAARVTVHNKFTKSAKTSISATFTPVTEPTYFYIWGPDGIARGKSGTYGVYLYPEYLQTNVTWTITGTGVTFNQKNGKVKVKKNAGDSFTLTATAGAIQATKTVKIVDPAKEVKITLSANEAVNAPKKNKKGNITSLRLYNVDIKGTDIEENRIQLSANVIGNDVPVTYKSSKPTVAYVDYNGMVIARRPGKTKITCTAGDGSGKKASINIQVIVPASDLSIIAKDGQAVIGYGKSAKLMAVPGRTYGKPSVSKVKWSLASVNCFASDGSSLGSIPISTIEQDKSISVKNGKVSVSKKMAASTASGVVPAYYGIEVAAETTDGTGIKKSHTLYTAKPASNLVAINPNSGKKAESKYRISLSGYNTFNSIYVATDAGQAIALATGSVVSPPVAKSSNPKVMSVTLQNVSKDLKYGLVYTYRMEMHKKGTATLTFKTSDGTNKKTSIKFFVQ